MPDALEPVEITLVINFCKLLHGTLCTVWHSADCCVTDVNNCGLMFFEVNVADVTQSPA